MKHPLDIRRKAPLKDEHSDGLPAVTGPADASPPVWDLDDLDLDQTPNSVETLVNLESIDGVIFNAEDEETNRIVTSDDEDSSDRPTTCDDAEEAEDTLVDRAFDNPPVMFDGRMMDPNRIFAESDAAMADVPFPEDSSGSYDDLESWGSMESVSAESGGRKALKKSVSVEIELELSPEEEDEVEYNSDEVFRKLDD